MRLAAPLAVAVGFVAGLVSWSPARAGVGTIVCAGSGSNLAAIRTLGARFSRSRPGVAVEVLPSIGSGGAVKAVAAGKIDLGLMSRELNREEVGSGIRLIPYAVSPLVFATRLETAAERLSMDAIKDALAGKDVHWPDGTVVRPVLRPRFDSDTQVLVTTFPELVPFLEKAYLRRGVPVAGVDQANMDVLERLEGSLGTVTLGAMRAENRRLKPITVAGMLPTIENVVDGVYPMVKTLYFAVGPRENSLVTDFVAYVHGPEGAAFLRETGHLPVTPDAGTLR